MIKRLVEFSLRHRGVVIGLACVLTGYGFYVAAHAKLDVFPEFAPPRVIIQTEAPGLSAEEVEQLVTRPVENGVNGVGGLDSVRSQSIQGLSVVTAVFREGTEIGRARQRVSERLVQIGAQLPAGVRAPTMTPLTSSTSMILVVGLTSKMRTPMELRTFADWTMRPRLLGVPGVANVTEFGGEARQLQIQVLPEKLIAHDLSIDDVVAAAKQSTGVSGGGFTEGENQRISIRMEGQSLTPAELGEVVVVHREGMTVRLKDVARVIDGPEPKVGDGGICWKESEQSIQSEPGVLLEVWSQYGANTLEVTAEVEKAVGELKPGAEKLGITLHPRLFRPASFIELAIRNIDISLAMGGVLVAVVLTLFLFNLRTAFISLTAIPLSLLVAVIVLDRFGVTLNTLTLGGFAIAIGEVVDDAIIDVENIFRRLRENREKGSPKSVFRVVLDASLEVRKAVVYATFIVALVFLPVLMMSGVSGKLFAPLAISYILATLASLAVALTVTPALSLVMLARANLREEPRFLRGMKNIHQGWLEVLVARPKTVMIAALVVCVASAAAIQTFGGEFLPEFREGHFIVQMQTIPGTSAPEQLRLCHEVARDMLANPKVRSVSIQVGRAELGEDTQGTDFTEFIVALNPVEGEEAEQVQGELRQTVAKYPGAKFAVKTFLAERMEETISGVKGQVAVKIYGDDLDVIDRKGGEVEEILSRIAGAADVKVEAPPGEPQLVVRLRRERLKQFGFRPVDVMQTVQTAYQGLAVAQTFDANRVFDVEVILDAAVRRDPESVGRLLLKNPDGIRVPLSDLADVFLTTGRHAIMHEGTRRYQAVSCNVRGRDLDSFVAEAKKKVGEKIVLPAGTYLAFGGAAEAERQSRLDILRTSLIAGAGIALLLMIVFRRVRNMLLVLANMPFALVGGVLAVFATGGALSVGSLVGFVTLFGITTRNSIMMVSHWEHLVAEEGMTWGVECALRGARERLVPVLMTALVTALGLLPIAIGTGDPGREIEGPMAIVILGGLATSTVLNLLVMPTLALRFGRFEKRIPEEEEATGAIATAPTGH